MTEAQLKSFPQFRSLPIFDEHDEHSAAITSPARGYSRVRPCPTVQSVKDSLSDAKLVPLGALRTQTDGGAVVVALFGEKD